MNNKTDSDPNIIEFENSLTNIGLHSALKYLNSRTPHRFTGIYKYDDPTLRNLVLYDSYHPELLKGDDAPMIATYCSLVKSEEVLEINNSLEDKRVNGIIITPVISYCGVLIKDNEGNPFGTVCHFDMKRCQERFSDFKLMEEAAKLIFNKLEE